MWSLVLFVFCEVGFGETGWFYGLIECFCGDVKIEL
jgi:hypothetical protein